jgi:MerR family transcriptional regulator, light-induced transcriptional regulator
MPNYLRIGAVSALTGVPADTLRAWERRYGIFHPGRTSGRFRLYSDDDIDRVRGMAALVADGVAASEAARRMRTPGAGTEADEQGQPLLAAAGQELHAAFRSFDAAAIESAIDGVLATADLDTAIRSVLLPALAEIGDDWAAGSLSIAQEHFSVGVLRGRLMGLARGWDDVSLLMFGLALHRRGWRITFLGANTPLADLFDTQRRLAPRLTVLFSASWEEHRDLVPVLAKAPWPVALAGATAGMVAEVAGCRWLAGDPVSAADEVTREAVGAATRPRPGRAQPPR